jgi:hypothetical protein
VTSGENKPDFVEEHLLLLMLDELGLQPTEANKARVPRTRQFRVRLIQARLAQAVAPMRQVEQRWNRLAAAVRRRYPKGPGR